MDPIIISHPFRFTRSILKEESQKIHSFQGRFHHGAEACGDDHQPPGPRRGMM